MTDYRRILLVVDLSEDSLLIGRRAQALAKAMRRRRSICCTWWSSCRSSPWARR